MALPDLIVAPDIGILRNISPELDDVPREDGADEPASLGRAPPKSVAPPWEELFELD